MDTNNGRDDSLKIERAVIADAGDLYRIARAAYSEDKKLYGCMPDCCESISKQLDNIHKYELYKIVYNGNTVGGIKLLNRGEGRRRIGDFYIDPAYQNLGIGTKVMNYALSLYPETVAWELDTPYKSYRNQHFYEGFGFKRLSVNKINDKFALINYEKVIDNG